MGQVFSCFTDNCLFCKNQTSFSRYIAEDKYIYSYNSDVEIDNTYGTCDL